MTENRLSGGVAAGRRRSGFSFLLVSVPTLLRPDGDRACKRGFPSFPATDRVPLCQTRVDAYPCSAGLEPDASDRVLRRALPQRAGASRGAGARRARRSGPAPPTAAWRGRRASVAKNHRNRKEGGPRPPRPSGKRLVPELPFRPRRTAARESRRRSSDFGDFLPQTAPPPAKPALARTRTRRARAGPPSGRAPRRALSPNGQGYPRRRQNLPRRRSASSAAIRPGLRQSWSDEEPRFSCRATDGMRPAASVQPCRAHGEGRGCRRVAGRVGSEAVENQTGSKQSLRIMRAFAENRCGRGARGAYSHCGGRSGSAGCAGAAFGARGARGGGRSRRRGRARALRGAAVRPRDAGRDAAEDRWVRGVRGHPAAVGGCPSSS